MWHVDVAMLTWHAMLAQAEREEMELRKAEMEAQKAENMVEHEAEIAARPPRTWFQTAKEKAAAVDRYAHPPTYTVVLLCSLVQGPWI